MTYDDRTRIADIYLAFLGDSRLGLLLYQAVYRAEWRARQTVHSATAFRRLRCGLVPSRSVSRFGFCSVLEFGPVPTSPTPLFYGIQKIMRDLE